VAAHGTLLGFTFAAVLLSNPFPARGTPEPADPTQRKCRLLEEHAEEFLTGDCLACHDGSAERPFCTGHELGVAYPEAGDPRLALRTPAAVLARGVNLPGGKLECVTCHDRRSTCPSHVAARDSRPPLSGGEAQAAEVPLRSRGVPICPTALCLSCHAFADGV
jgi:hypothetical protein